MIIGVGFLLFSADKILIIRENKDKPEICKKAGMLTFPLETFKEDDKSFFGTIERIIEEEIGFSTQKIKKIEITSFAGNLIPNRPDVVTVYGTGVFFGNKEERVFPKDPDVDFFGWMKIHEIMDHEYKRVEVAPILKHFMKGK
jgi:hypothetical protein